MSYSSHRSFASNLLAALLAVLILFGSARQAEAQAGVEVTEAQARYNFGSNITFTARIQSVSPIQGVTVSFRNESGLGQVQPMTVNPDGTVSYRYDASLNTIPPFSVITYWFNVTLVDGTTINSTPNIMHYDDDRFTWQSREDGMLRLHWYEGDEAFAQAALDAARRGLQSAGALMQVDLTAPVDIYVYANTNDLQGALFMGGLVWEAGKSYPELGVVLAAIPAGAEQSVQLERRIPHELAHILLYRQIGANYNRLPPWLTEGLSTQAELSPNPDFDSTLQQAAASNTLLPLSGLCETFPVEDTLNSLLAYAESASFMRYLQEKHGASGVMSLAAAYADGLDCEQGAQQALGLPLSELEKNWRQEKLGENRGGVVTSNLLPYLLLLALILLVPIWSAVSTMLRKRSEDDGE